MGAGAWAEVGAGARVGVGARTGVGRGTETSAAEALFGGTLGVGAGS